MRARVSQSIAYYFISNVEAANRDCSRNGLFSRKFLSVFREVQCRLHPMCTELRTCSCSIEAKLPVRFDLTLSRKFLLPWRYLSSTIWRTSEF